MNKVRTRWLVGATLLGLGLAGCGDNTPAPVGPAPQPVPIRRLTNDEYAASVADLFPSMQLPDLSFVSDSKVLGFTNLSSSQTSSLVRTEQYEAAAEAIAKTVAADPTALTGCDATVQGEAACGQPYLFDLAKRAYRRPVTDGEKLLLGNLLALNSDSVDYPTRLWLSIEAVLLSPKFLFRPEIGTPSKMTATGIPLTPHEIATRLSYFINGSIPDAELTAAADSGKLSSREEVIAQAQRLMTLPRSQTNLVKFLTQWLGVDTIGALTKDPTVYPTFSPLLASDMGQETRTFLQYVMFQGGTFKDLFTADYTFASAGLASFYGLPAPANDWDKVSLDTSQRQGILTQASLLATMAKDNTTDPVRRGKFVLQQLLCRSIPSPTPDIVAMFQPLDLSKTARDQFTQHRQSDVCNTCHQYLDPLGLPFEHYDGMGAWRDTDRGMTLDVTGMIDGQGFDGVPQLEQLLVNKPEARSCYISEWFRFSNGRLDGDADVPYISYLANSFTPDTKLADLVVSIVESDSFRYITPPGSTP